MNDFMRAIWAVIVIAAVVGYAQLKDQARHRQQENWQAMQKFAAEWRERDERLKWFGKSSAAGGPGLIQAQPGGGRFTGLGGANRPLAGLAFDWSKATMPGPGYAAGLNFPPGFDLPPSDAVAPMPRERAAARR